jgi:hypothetical protein
MRPPQSTSHYSLSTVISSSSSCLFHRLFLYPCPLPLLILGLVLFLGLLVVDGAIGGRVEDGKVLVLDYPG